MSIKIINRKDKYYHKTKKLINFFLKIERICIEHKKYELQIDIINLHAHKITRLARYNYQNLIKNRFNKKKYDNITEIKYTTVISTLYDDKHGEILISLDNIAKKHKMKIRNIEYEIKIYIAHCILNLYETSNRIYVFTLYLLVT